MYVRTDTTEELDPRNVYIRSLPEDCDDAALEALAAPYGAIESSKSIMDEATGKCKGYGFVMYQTEDQAAHAIAALNAMGLHSSLARDSLKSKLKRLQDRNSTNVYVANLPADMDEARLVELLRPHRVVSAKILRDSATGQHRSVGFARMEDRESAMAAIELLKGMVLPNAPAPLSPRIADSADQKRLKRLFGVAGPPRLPTADDVALVRSANASPAMWSPVLVYTPAGSPPPMLPLPAAVDHYPGYPPPPPAFGYASPPGGYASPPRHQFPMSLGQRPTSSGQRPTSPGQRSAFSGQCPTSSGQRPTSPRQRPTSPGQRPTLGQLTTPPGQHPAPLDVAQMRLPDQPRIPQGGSTGRRRRPRGRGRDKSASADKKQSTQE